MSLNNYIILIITMMLGLCSAAQADLYNKRVQFAPELYLETNTHGSLLNDSIYLATQNINGTGPVYVKIDTKDGTVLNSFDFLGNTGYYSGIQPNIVLVNDSIVLNCVFHYNSATTNHYLAFTTLNTNTMDTMAQRIYNDTSTLFSERWQMMHRIGDSLIFIGLYNTTGNQNDPNLYIIKTDMFGEIGWSKVQPEIDHYLSNSILTEDGNFIVTGKCLPTNPVSSSDEWDNFIFKIDPQGNRIWSIYHRGDMNNGIPQVIEVDDGYIYTSNKRIDYDYFVSEEEASHINGLEPGDNLINWLIEDLYAYKVDFDGNPVSEKKLNVRNPVNYIDTWAMIKTNDGNIAISIEYDNSLIGDGNGKGAIYKITSDLDSLWFRRYQVLNGQVSFNHMRDIEQLPDGGFFCNGYCNPADASDPCCQDAWLMRTNCLGFLEWPVAAFESYNGNNYNIHLDNNSTSFGTCTVNWGDGSAYSLVNEGMDSIISHKYPDNQTYTVTLTASACGVDSTISFEVTPSVVAIPEIANDLTFAIYPNPTSNWVTVTFQALKNKGSLSVINLDGKIMLQKKLEQGQEEIELNTSEFNSGIYLINIQVDGSNSIRKMNVIN